MVWIKGQKAWNKGINHLSINAKARISNTMHKRMSENHPRYMLGKKHSKATKKRISESMKKSGWFPPSPPKNRSKIICKICCKEKEVRNKQKNQKYCSYKCYGIAQRNKPKKCLDCNKFICNRPETKRCHVCHGRQYVGKNSPLWKGGLTLIQKLIRSSTKYLKWRKKVFKRDNWTCIKCKQRGLELNADHHPIAFSIIIKKHKIKTMQDALKCKLLWSLKNGRTLCLNCHKKTDNYAGKTLCR